MQSYTSKDTSINKTKASAIYSNKKAIDILTNKTVIDIGGGKFDIAIDIAKKYNCNVRIYDKFNRDSLHNKTVLNDKYDIAIISNVLNVIAEKEERAKVLQLALSKAKIVLITVYEGNKNGIGKQSKRDCWQENRVTKDYLGEIRLICGCKKNVRQIGKMIIISQEV